MVSREFPELPIIAQPMSMYVIWYMTFSTLQKPTCTRVEAMRYSKKTVIAVPNSSSALCLPLVLNSRTETPLQCSSSHVRVRFQCRVRSISTWLMYLEARAVFIGLRYTHTALYSRLQYQRRYNAGEELRTIVTV